MASPLPWGGLGWGDFLSVHCGLERSGRETMIFPLLRLKPCDHGRLPYTMLDKGIFVWDG